MSELRLKVVLMPDKFFKMNLLDEILLILTVVKLKASSLFILP
jgi:hypothetical protein